MSITYAIYNDTTGRITKTLVVGDDYTLTNVELNADVGESGLLVPDGTTAEEYYVDVTSTPTLTLRPSLDTICTLSGDVGWLANGSDVVQYGTALPNPTSYFVQTNVDGLNGAQGQITDGTFALTTPVVGSYTITLSAFPYADKILTLEAV